MPYLAHHSPRVPPPREGYEPLADGLFDVTAAADFLELSFTSAYMDISKKCDWKEG